jgi:hypothetical protein
MAMDDLRSLLTNPDTGPANALQADDVRKILGAALFAGAVGAGGRTLQGLHHFLRRNLAPPPKIPLRQSVIPVPVAVDKEAAARPLHAVGLRLAAALEKSALEPPARFGSEPGRWTAEHVAHLAGLMRPQGANWGSARNFMTGWGAANMGDKPWVIPAAAAAVGGGLYGGYKLTDWLLDKTRRREQDSELEAAKRRYEAALMGRFDKEAAAGSDPLDELAASCMEKDAALGTLAGLALLGMGTIGLGSGLASYNWARSRSRTKALEEAIRRRQEALFAQSPRPIMAVPIPRPRPAREKAGSAAQAADQVLARLRQQRAQQWASWQQTIRGDAGKPEKAPARPAQPVPPRLPSLAGLVAGDPARPAG